MAFQQGAFQSPGFQQRHFSGGTTSKKFDSEAYAYVYNHADRLRNRVQELPEEVKQVVEEVVKIDSKPDRTKQLSVKLDKIELKFQRVYNAILEEYYQALLDEQLTIYLLEAENRRRIEEENLIILLALS